MKRMTETFRRPGGAPLQAALTEGAGRECLRAGMDASSRLCRLYVKPGTALRQGETLSRARDGRRFRVLSPAAQPPSSAGRVWAVTLCEEVTDA